MRTLKKLIILTTALFVTDIPGVISGSLEFSAEAVVSSNQQDVRKTRLYVGEHAVRRDMLVNGYRMTEIVFPEQGLALLINDHTRSFQERTFPGVSKAASESHVGRSKIQFAKKLAKKRLMELKQKNGRLFLVKTIEKQEHCTGSIKTGSWRLGNFFPMGR